MSKASRDDKSGHEVGYFYWSRSGQFYANNSHKNWGTDTKCGAGDEITVCLNLDANTIAFRKNSTAVCEAQHISNEPYCFVFRATTDGSCVTIVGLK